MKDDGEGELQPGQQDRIKIHRGLRAGRPWRDFSPIIKVFASRSRSAPRNGWAAIHSHPQARPAARKRPRLGSASGSRRRGSPWQSRQRNQERRARNAGRGMAGELFRAQGAGHRRPHRIHRRPDHVPDHGLHRVRQSGDPEQSRHGSGRGVRRHLRRRRGEHDGDGALRQLPDRARARHGHQRLLRLHRGADLQIYLAAGAGRGVLLRRAVLPDLGVPHPAIRHRVDPAEPQARGLGRRRAVPRHHRAGGSPGRGRPSGDAGHARRFEKPGARS